MGTVETRSKAPSGRSSPSPENEKNELREALCALKGGERENGVGFSSHGNRGLGDDGVVEVVKSRVFETKVSVQRDIFGGNDCQGLADSEMNGVSSLLKMRGSGSRSVMFSYGGGSDGAEKLNSVYGYERRAMAIGGGSFGVGNWKKSEDEDDQDGRVVTIDVPIAETSENKDAEMEDLSDEGYGFSVGDFVWGKIKSHPWWPGRIYDPSDASDYALKLRQKNRLLVAYFGDGTFAWCHPSQLKPFEVNFEDMVIQSSSRAFVNAVQEAVNEVGRLLDLKMTYSCAAKKTRSEFAPPLAMNSGIRDGVLVPENGIERLSAVLIDPAELLSRVKHIAEIIAVASILELEILKATLSAFYLSRGGYKLPNYEEPQPIPGLEDSLIDETVEDVGNSKGAVEAPAQGPFEEDYSTLPVSPKSVELSHSLGISGNRSNHRRKQKSIAEIMGKDEGVFTKTKELDATEEVMVRKKRKGSEDAMTSKTVQKRKGLLPNTDTNVPSAENDGSGGKEKSEKDTLSQLKEKKEAFGNENTISGSKKETDEEGKAKEQSEKGSMPRERKKSKYLSPPFTTPIRGQTKGDVETESLKVSSKARLSEQMSSAAGQLLKSPRPQKCNSEAFQENFSKEVAIEQELPDSSNYQTPEDGENKTIDPTKIQASSGEVLSEFRYAAISPQIPRGINSLEKFVDFISVFRSSLYRQGSYYKEYKKRQPGRKRKKPESELGMLRKDLNQTDHISSNNDSEPSKRRRKKETTSGMSKEKQAAIEAKTGTKGTDENASSATLFVSFGPGSSLPSKSDLITLYSKFGALNESETDMFSSSYTARVSFLKASDAENALNHSQNMSPFGSSQVSFRLLYLSTGSKSGEHGEKSKSKGSSAKKKDKTPAKPSASLSPGSKAYKLNFIKQRLQGLKPSASLSPVSEAYKLNFIKQKLQGLTSMLEASDGKSPDMKTKLESEMKGLLEDVNKMVESSSS